LVRLAVGDFMNAPGSSKPSSLIGMSVGIGLPESLPCQH
jgi:hypothetical protein